MTIRAWAGIVSNSIHQTKEKDSEYKIMAIFKNKRIAKLAYEYVVPCEIIFDMKEPQ